MRFTRSLLLVASLSILPTHMPAQSGAHKTPADQFEFHMKTTGFEAFDLMTPRHRLSLAGFVSEDDTLVGCQLVSNNPIHQIYSCCDPNGENCVVESVRPVPPPAVTCSLYWYQYVYPDGSTSWYAESFDISCV